jgi:hypothetical protein
VDGPQQPDAEDPDHDPHAQTTADLAQPEDDDVGRADVASPALEDADRQQGRHRVVGTRLHFQEGAESAGQRHTAEHAEGGGGVGGRHDRTHQPDGRAREVEHPRRAERHGRGRHDDTHGGQQRRRRDDPAQTAWGAARPPSKRITTRAMTAMV